MLLKSVFIAWAEDTALGRVASTLRRLVRRNLTVKLALAGSWVADVVLAAYFAIWKQDVTGDPLHTNPFVSTGPGESDA